MATAPLRARRQPRLLSAIVAVEDARFHDHAGVDWRAALAAAWQNVSGLEVRRGASTITMQLHRLRDPRPGRSPWGKVEQAIRARQMERQQDKRAILVEYVNRAPFGGNLVGAGAASWRYFGKPVTELSLGQAALLAGLPKNPNRYRPDRFPARAAARRGHVLDRMLAVGAITPAEHAEARAEPWPPRGGRCRSRATTRYPRRTHGRPPTARCRRCFTSHRNPPAAASRLHSTPPSNGRLVMRRGSTSPGSARRA